MPPDVELVLPLVSSMDEPKGHIMVFFVPGFPNRYILEQIVFYRDKFSGRFEKLHK